MDDKGVMASTEGQKLTNWKNEPSLADLKQNWTDAKPFHDTQSSKIQEYLDNMNGTGKAAVKTKEGNSKLVPRLIRKQAEWRYAPLSEPFLSTDDLFNVKPATHADIHAATQNELLLNHQFTVDIDRVAFIDEYVRTAVDEGTVAVQVGWDFEEEDYEEEVPTFEYVLDESQAGMIQELMAMQEQNPEQFAQVPEELKQALTYSMEMQATYVPRQTGTELVKKTRTVVNRPTVDIRNSKNLLIDPTCEGKVEKAKFVVYSFESSLSELRKKGRYKNLDRVNISSSSILNVPDHEVSKDIGSFNFKDKPREKFVVYEYWGFWDIKGDGKKLTPIVAAWVDGVLIRMEENPFPDKQLPFVVVQYLPVRKQTHGEPDGALLVDNQRVVGAIMRGMVDVLGKSANGQTGIRRDMLDATNRRRYDKGLDYEFNSNVDPRQGVFMHTYPEFPQSAQVMLQLQNHEAESMSGVKSYSQGIGSASLGDVAAGIRGALDASSKRELGILRRLSNGLVKIGRKIIAMNAEFLSDEEVVRITDDEFVEVKRDDLPGNFDLRLGISTAEEDNNKAEQLAFMLQTVGPSEDPVIRRKILANIFRLRKMPDLAKDIESYEPQPDPVQQEIQQLELAKLRAEVAKLNAEVGLGNARASNEDAKTQKTKSETDLLNLDFVEQEAGVKQERDLEKQGAQARAQTQTKLAEHQLNIDRDNNKAVNDRHNQYLSQQVA